MTRTLRRAEPAALYIVEADGTETRVTTPRFEAALAAATNVGRITREEHDIRIRELIAAWSEALATHGIGINSAGNDYYLLAR